MAKLDGAQRDGSALRLTDLDLSAYGLLEEAPLGVPVAAAMRFPTVVAENTPLSRGAELLVRDGASLLVIVDEHRRPLGVVLPVDVISAARRAEARALDGMTVLDAARSGGRFMPETSSVRAAHLALLEENRDFFVVVARDGRLAGVITAMDVLEALDAPPPPASTTREIVPLRGLR